MDHDDTTTTMSGAGGQVTTGETQQIEAAPIQPVPLEEQLGTWRKVVVAALGLAWPKRFASLAVPAVFAEQLAAEFGRVGFGTRVSAVGRPPASRTLAIWERAQPTAEERIRARWGRALHRNGLVIEDGYRQAPEMSDEDVRHGAWFG